MTVVDASIVVGLVLSPTGHAATALHLRGEPLHAPALLDIEVVSALRGQALSGRVSSAQCAEAIALLQEARIQRESHEPLLGRIWELRENLTVYHATYVALAEALHTTLLTGDQCLARAPGIRCPVEVVGA